MEPVLPPEMPEINGYQDVRLIRPQGGMSHLYRGTRIGTGQEVIIKLMPAPKDPQEALTFQHRFNQEIRIARLSTNQHLLAATDHGDMPMPGTDEGRLYLVYPYIEHGSLADLLTLEQPWETWELPHIADVIAQAAEGLFHLHKSGMVHQDVRPNNFLWMPTDPLRNPLRRIHIWLIGFGAAEPERTGKTRDIKGNLTYLAPEQLNGVTTHSVDQYALALVARLLLTGHEPAPMNEPASLLSARPTQLNQQHLFEPEIDTVLLKALAPDPEARFPTVIEFAQALQKAVLKQIQVTRRTASARPSPKPTEPLVLPPLVSPKPYEPPRSRDGLQTRFAARTRASGHALPAVAAQQWITVSLPDTLRMLAWSPGGTELACTFYHDLPQLISVKHSVETLPGFAPANSACWSPDGCFLAISMDNGSNPQAEIRFCDRTAPKDRHRVLSFDQPGPIRAMDWSRTGLFALWLEHKLLVYDLSDLSAQKRLPDPEFTFLLGDDMSCDQLTTLRWSPGGTWLAAGSNNGEMVCWQPHTDRYLQEHPLKKNIRSLSWSPNGKMLVVAFANKQVLFWDQRNGEITQAELPEPPRMVSTSPQTGHIAIATEKALFFFANPGALAPTAMHPGRLFAAFSPDNKLATLDEHGGNELIIWQI